MLNEKPGQKFIEQAGTATNQFNNICSLPVTIGQLGRVGIDQAASFTDG